MTKEELLKYENVYFVGIGGIGMSALARFFVLNGKNVAGYDKVSTPLTDALQTEGIQIHFDDQLNLVPEPFKNAPTTLVVYTPAIPKEHSELIYFQNNPFVLMKRAQVLGALSKAYRTVAVAGTHGKTTMSTMTTHLLNGSTISTSAFLGGISKNLNSNLLLSPNTQLVVTEADEYDRSFLNLYPHTALIGSMDADHLDIYGAKEAMHQSFFEFINQIEPGGNLVQKIGLPHPDRSDIQRYTYSLDDSRSDFYASKMALSDDLYTFDLVTPMGKILNLKLGVPGIVNVENAIGASALALLSGIQSDELRLGLESYSGVKRRFDYRIKTSKLIYIDDYAHHPEELKAFITSVRQLYPNKKISGIFQPHLFTRTRDFAEGFATSLGLLDELFLMDIYPARELPIPGVDSQMVLNQVQLNDKMLCSKDNLLDILSKRKFEVLLTLGAGDIDQFVEPIEALFKIDDFKNYEF